MASVHGAAEQTHVEVVEQTAGFEALRPLWNGLLRESAANNPFLTWEWLYAWWTKLGDGSRLRLLVVYVGKQIVAIAPLRAVRSHSPWFSSLEFLGTGFAGSDYLDLIVRSGFEGAAIEAFAESIASQGLALRLSHLPAGSLAARLAARLEGDGWARRESSVGWCPLIQLAGHSWESYLATRGPAHRANVRRRIRSLLGTFTVQFERVTTDSRRLEMLEALTRFHDRRFDGPRGSTAFQTQDLQAFHRDVTERALDAGWLRMYALVLDGQIAAVMYAFTDDRRFYFYQHGFDERYEKHSLGLVLMALTVRAAIEEGATEFDLLCGEESYKWLWADDKRPLSHVDLFPARLGGWVYQRTIETTSRVRALARRMRVREGHVA